MLLVMLSGNTEAEWVAIAHDNDNATVLYADLATIHRADDTASMWVLFDFKTRQTSALRKLSYSSAKSRAEFDCADPQWRILYNELYSGQMGKGETVEINDGNSRPSPITPGTLFETAWKVACGAK